MLTTIRRAILIAALLAPPAAFGQQNGEPPAIAYILPDIGAPGMNTYVEIIAPNDAFQSFGNDGVYLNNPGDALRVVCAIASDTSKIIIGPLVVSWNGRMIATQIFVPPSITPPNSTYWDALQQQYRIPIRVVARGQRSNADTFYIVNPTKFGIKANPGVIGSGGPWGTRSRRGAMIVDSMALLGRGSYRFSTLDCDPRTAGSQGLLPAVVISQSVIVFGPGTTLQATGNAQHAGPGGGGAGAGGSDSAGHGFTSGGYNCFTHVVLGSNANGSSLNQVAPGGSACDQGGGGGAGHPFGQSGGAGQANQPSAPGGYGGGSGGGETSGGRNPFGGGGAANATPGSASSTGQENNGGFVVGNGMIVPLAGGSGGGAGNERGGTEGFPVSPDGNGGSGGGGGGGVAMYCVAQGNFSNVVSNGMPGGNGGFGDIGGAGGGGGAGGNIVLGSKISLQASAIVRGGPGGAPGGNAARPGGDGGAGRVRVDGRGGFTTSPPEATVFIGPTTDTSQYVFPSFTLRGTGNGENIDLYLRPLNGKWALAGSVSGYVNGNWLAPITLPGNDTEYFLVAAQRVSDGNINAYTMDVPAVLSQAAANILKVHGAAPMIASDTSLALFVAPCDSEAFATVWVRNAGSRTLSISRAMIGGLDAAYFTLIQPTVFPVLIPPGDSTAFVVRVNLAGVGQGNAMLVLSSNDSSAGHLPWSIVLAGIRDSATSTVRIDTIDASVGDHVAIPVRLTASHNLAACGATQIAYSLRYDRSLLVPEFAAPGVDAGRDRILSLTASPADTIGVLDSLRFTATLGDTDQTPLHFESFSWTGAGATSTTIDGVFRLTNICRQGGSRFVSIGAAPDLEQNAPNPFVDETLFRFRTNEPGHVRIVVADMLGREVASVCDDEFPAGMFTRTFSAVRLPAGMYSCTLQTPTLRRTIVMMKCQ